MTNIIAYSTIVREDSSSVDESSEGGRVLEDQEGLDEELGVGNLVGLGAKRTTLFSGFGKGCLSFVRSANSAGLSSGLKGVTSISAPIEVEEENRGSRGMVDQKPPIFPHMISTSAPIIKVKEENRGSRGVVDQKPPIFPHMISSSAPIKVKEENRGSRGVVDQKPPIFPHHVDAELSAAGWPHWLIAVAGEAIRGLVPRRADNFEKLERIWEGAWSGVFKARDLSSGKLVALKKVRFDLELEPESVKFMVREILILRKLDHPNVLKWEGLVTSTMSHSLYLIFEYVEHDLASLAAQPEVNFTMPQVKSYMHQLLLGLEHYHSRGLLHHDIKMSNLFINDRGVLKIAEFGSATFFGHNFKYPITSYAINLWYQPPELLLGETYYDVGVDLWSAGCVLGELLFGKPIMPGRTKVEQLLRIFELCGSPSEEYWNRSKLPYATLFKPQRPYKRRIAESFNNFPPSLLQLIETLLAIDPAERKSATAALMSEFFIPELFAPYPSRIPHFSPSKEVDVKQCKAKARRKGEAVMKGQKARAISAPNGNAELILSMQKGQMQPNFKSWGEKFDPHREEVASGFPIDLPRQSQAVEETEKGQREHNNKASLFGTLTYQTRWTESSRNQDHAPNMSSGDNLSTLPSLMAATNLLADSSGGKPGSSQPVATKFINRWLPGPFHEVSECNRKQEMERQAQGSSSSNQNEDDSINSWDQILPGNDSKVNRIFYGGSLFTPPALSNLDQLFKKYSPLIQNYAREAQLDERLRKSKLEGTK